MPYVGAGVLASSLCMDKVVFKEVLAAAGVPAGALRGRARAALARRAGGRRCASWPCSALPVFVKPARLGSSVGIAKVELGGRARPGARHRLRPRPARDRRGLLAGHGGRVRGARHRRRPRPRSRARSCSPAAPTGTTTRPSTPTGGMELVVPARLPDHVLEEVRRLAVRDLRARRLRRPGPRGLLRRGRRARARQRAQHAARASRRRASTRSCGRRPGCRSRRCATGCSALALERFARRAADRPRSSAPRVLGRVRSAPTSTWISGSRRGRLAELRDPDQVVAVGGAVGVQLEALVASR